MTFFTKSNAKKAAILIGFLASSANAVEEPVDLGTAGDFAILTKSGVTTTGVTSVRGDVGVSPIAATGMTGFGLVMDPSNTFSTSSLVDGKVYAADYASPTPSKMTTAISDMEEAYADAASRSNPDHEELGAGNIDGETLSPGLYRWSTVVGFNNTLTFEGNGSPNEDVITVDDLTAVDDLTSNDVWVLQIAEGLTVGSGAQVKLTRGAKAENIFWQVAGSTVFGTDSHLEGVFLCATNIVFQTRSSMNGTALAQTAVTLDAATIKNKTASN